MPSARTVSTPPQLEQLPVPEHVESHVWALMLRHRQAKFERDIEIKRLLHKQALLGAELDVAKVRGNEWQWRR